MSVRILTGLHSLRFVLLPVMLDYNMPVEMHPAHEQYFSTIPFYSLTWVEGGRTSDTLLAPYCFASHDFSRKQLYKTRQQIHIRVVMLTPHVAAVTRSHYPLSFFVTC